MNPTTNSVSRVTELVMCRIRTNLPGIENDGPKYNRIHEAVTEALTLAMKDGPSVLLNAGGGGMMINRAKSSRSMNWLDEALNSGDGTYKP